MGNEVVDHFSEIQPLGRDFVLRNWENRNKKQVFSYCDQNSRMAENFDQACWKFSEKNV